MGFNERDLPALDPRARSPARLILAQEREPSAARNRRIRNLAKELLSTEEQLADAWIDSDDTGTSSETIWSALSGRRFIRGGHGSTPMDGSDFGRCYRLIAKIPAWRQRLPEVARAYPHWDPIVRNWDRLVAMYEAALAADLEREGYAVSEWHSRATAEA